MKLTEIRKKDFQKAIQFAITGMHFDWYFENPFLLKLYGSYFWYQEISRATQIIAAYHESELVGVLLADMKGEEKKYRSFWGNVYIKLFDLIQNTFFQKSAGAYHKANRNMFEEYRSNHSPDGEIIFLAADPDRKEKGIGSRLLSELARREIGKKVYLYTDNACTYQFYEHRGFERSCEREIMMDMGNKKVPLTCFLYSKTLV